MAADVAHRWILGQHRFAQLRRRHLGQHQEIRDGLRQRWVAVSEAEAEAEVEGASCTTTCRGYACRWVSSRIREAQVCRLLSLLPVAAVLCCGGWNKFGCNSD